MARCAANARLRFPHLASALSTPSTLQRSRLQALALLAAAVLCVVWLRAVPAGSPLLGPPCPVHLYLHLLCPGCGGTHALGSLLHGELGAAWHANALLVCLLPAALLYGSAVLVRLWQGTPAPWPHLPPRFAYGLAAAAFAFTFWRNLP